MSRWYDLGSQATVKLEERNDGVRYLALRLAQAPSVERHNLAIANGWVFDDELPEVARNYAVFSKLSEVQSALRSFFTEHSLREALKSEPTSDDVLEAPEATTAYPDPKEISRLVEAAGSLTQSRIEAVIASAQADRLLSRGEGHDLLFGGDLFRIWRESIERFGAADATRFCLSALSDIQNDPNTAHETARRYSEGVETGKGFQIQLDDLPNTAFLLAQDLADRFRSIGDPEWKFYVRAFNGVRLPTTRIFDEKQVVEHPLSRSLLGYEVSGQGGVTKREVDAFRHRIGLGVAAVADLFGRDDEKVFLKKLVKFQLAPLVTSNMSESVGFAERVNDYNAVKLSPRNLGAGLHEIGHLIDYSSMRSEELHSAIANSDLTKEVRELTGHLSQAKRDYYNSPVEIFARLTEAVGHRRAELSGDSYFGSVGGVSMTVGEWLYLPASDSLEKYVADFKPIVRDGLESRLETAADYGVAP